MTGATSSNSTDAGSVAAAFGRLDEQVGALASAHPELRLPFTAEGGDASHYRPAFRPVLTRADMELGGERGELAELAQLWAGTPLEALMHTLRDLADALAGERAGAADDPDAPYTLIYQMY